MSSHGELNQRARRPSTPGQNTQILFNNNGVDGANANLTFDRANNILAIGGPANTTPFILNQGRGTISIQGQGTQNDALLMFQNSTGFVGGYVYCSNTELRIDSQSGANVTVYAAGIPTININASQANVNGTMNVSNVISHVSDINANPSLLLHNLNVADGRCSIAFIQDRTPSQTWHVGIDPDGGATKNFSFRDITQNRIPLAIANTGAIKVPASPTTNTVTQVMTGLSANLTANLTTNGNSAQTNTLSVTFNEAGMYRIDGMILLGSNNGANVANAGMNIAFGNTGTATIATIKYAVQGRANGTTIVSNLISTTAQSVILAAASTFANSTNATDYLVLTGYMNVSAVGTVNIAFASANSANLSFNVMPNTYIVYTKIG